MIFKLQFESFCHCEPVTDVTGVAIPRLMGAAEGRLGSPSGGAGKNL